MNRRDEEQIGAARPLELLGRVHRGAQPEAPGEVWTHLVRPGRIHRQVQVGTNQQRDVEPAVDRQLRACRLEERGQPARAVEEATDRRPRIPVLDADVRTQRGDRLERRPVSLLGQAPVGEDDELREPQSTRPSTGLEAEP